MFSTQNFPIKPDNVNIILLDLIQKKMREINGEECGIVAFEDVRFQPKS